MKDVSVIIVNWNVRDELLACLDSLRSQEPGVDMEVLVVDNASTDGSAEAVRQGFPAVRVIENRDNVGFARANNQALPGAAGRHFLFLNPDTICQEDSIRYMVLFLDAHPEVAAVGPRLLNGDGRSIQYWGGRRLPQPMDVFFEYAKLTALFPQSKVFARQLMPEWDHRTSRPVECLSGACMMVRREIVDSVGCFDEGYPLYWEDTDWCFRIGATSGTLFYLAEAPIIHLGGQSSIQSRGRSMVNSIKGAYRYYSKCYGLQKAIGVWMLVVVATVLKMAGWLLRGVFVPNARREAWGQVSAYLRICLLFPRRVPLR